jgi:hypothetical protein
MSYDAPYQSFPTGLAQTVIGPKAGLVGSVHPERFVREMIATESS